MIESHERNQSCNDQFVRFDNYMTTGITFREAVIRHEQQIKTLDLSNMEFKQTVKELENKIDDKFSSINKTLLELTTKIESLTIGVSSEEEDRLIISDSIDKLDKRLKVVEIWRWLLLGGFAVVLFLIEKIWK